MNEEDESEKVVDGWMRNERLHIRLVKWKINWMKVHDDDKLECGWVVVE